METRFLRSESPPEGWAKYWNNILPTPLCSNMVVCHRVHVLGNLQLLCVGVIQLIRTRQKGELVTSFDVVVARH